MNNDLSLPYLSSRTLPLHLPGAQWGEWPVSLDKTRKTKVKISMFLVHSLIDKTLLHLQSDHKKTPQLISFLFEIRFQQAIHQIKGFKKYYKLDNKCCP
jgi:hypothetical protein